MNNRSAPTAVPSIKIQASTHLDGKWTDWINFMEKSWKIWIRLMEIGYIDHPMEIHQWNGSNGKIEYMYFQFYGNPLSVQLRKKQKKTVELRTSSPSWLVFSHRMPAKSFPGKPATFPKLPELPVTSCWYSRKISRQTVFLWGFKVQINMVKWTPLSQKIGK